MTVWEATAGITADPALAGRSPSKLVVSPLTAKTHVSRLFGKLDAGDRAQLVVLAYESGLVTPQANGKAVNGPVHRRQPTSNKSYAEVGFRGFADWADHGFEHATPESRGSVES